MQVQGIVLHLSASRWGDAKAITSWHKARGFTTIGYHGVILNGCRGANLKYLSALDGKIEPGRPQNIAGAHCKAGGMNACTLGVCLIGTPGFHPERSDAADPNLFNAQYATARQLDALLHWLRSRCAHFNLDPRGTFKHPTTGRTCHVISQHSDYDIGKPLCASWKLDELRKLI